MTKTKDSLKLLIKHQFKDIVDNGKIIIDDKILEELIEDNQISQGIEMIHEKINNMSESFLPELSLQYKASNISVGKDKTLTLEYLDIPTEKLDKYQIIEIVGLNEIGGISWNNETQSFEGIAENAGDFHLKIKGIHYVSAGIKQKTFGTCTVTVIPDPKSLWKTLEPDDSIPYGKTHDDSDSMVSKDGNRLLYVSKRGRSHAHVGTYRDDDGKLLVSDSGWSIIAIADGGGSYSLSRRGSKLAVDASADALKKVLSGQIGNDLEEAFFKNEELNSKESKDVLDKNLKDTILSAAFTGLHAIREEAEETKHEIKDYSTTLLIAAHKNTPNGHIIVTFWVGDGVITLYTKEKDVFLLGEPDSGEFAGQTRFLDDSFFHDTSRVRIKLVNDFTALILATDGVSDPYFETDASLGDVKKWDRFWEKIGSLVSNPDIRIAETELLKWLDFWSPGNHDDRSIALLLPNMDNEAKYEKSNKGQNIIPEQPTITTNDDVIKTGEEGISTQTEATNLNDNTVSEQKDESLGKETEKNDEKKVKESTIIEKEELVSVIEPKSNNLEQNESLKDDENG